MLSVNVDLGEVMELLNLQEVAMKAVRDAAFELSKITRAHILELAQAKLHSRRELYIENLSDPRPVGEDTWVISLDAKARWIDDGQPEHNMIDALLRSPKAKTAKDGSKYLVIPFKMGPGKGAASSTPAQTDLISTLKREMKSRGIPFAKIERSPDGNARVGKLHSFDVMKEPIKSGMGPGQGWGPVGQVRQGPNERQKVGGGPGGGGSPFLQGVNVYQTKDPKAKSGVKREIMTFRIVSSKHKSQGGRWEHPGNAPMNIMEDGLKWALEIFQTQVAPAILAQITTSVG